MSSITARLFILSLVLLFAPLSASATDSDKNQKARSYDITGKVDSVQSMKIKISGKTYKLSPVVKILSPDNKTVLLSQIEINTRVGCKLESLGKNKQVKQIWILSDDEPMSVTAF